MYSHRIKDLPGFSNKISVWDALTLKDAEKFKTEQELKKQRKKEEMHKIRETWEQQMKHKFMMTQQQSFGEREWDKHMINQQMRE